MAEHSPGSWYGIVSAAGIALLPASVPPQTVRRVWSDLRQGRGIGAVIDGLVGAFGTSLSQLPHFAVMYTEEDGGARIAVRGPVEARVFTSDSSEPRVVSGLGVATWNERTLPEATSGELSVPGAVIEPVLPITEGVVLAGRVAYVFADPSGMLPVSSADTTEDAAPIDLDADQVAPESPSSPLGAAALPVSEPASELQPEPEPEVTPQPEPESESEAEQVAIPSPEAPPQSSLADLLAATETTPPEALPDASKEPSRTAETVLTEAVPTEYDQLLFGETVLSSVESAAVRVTEPDHDEEAHQPAPPGLPASPPSPPLSAVAAAPVAPPSTGSGLISVVPLGSSVVPAPVSGPSGWDDHDGETIMVDQLPSLPGERPAPSAIPPARTSPSLIMAGRAPLLLDRSAIIGTRPKLNRVQGANVPHLVSVESPNSEISRNHLELRVEGADVLAIDLNSTNGTMLLRVGADPVRLQPREAHLLVGGDQLDLGDGVLLSFEGLA